MYLVKVFLNGEFHHYLEVGRPFSIRVYESVASANRGISQYKANSYGHKFTYQIVEITEVTEVTE